MKYSTKLSDTLHLLVFLYLGENTGLTSSKIAESIKTNPSYIRQLMSKLKTAGLVVSAQGKAVASLAKPPDKITMYEVYKAVEGDKPLLHLDTDVNPECGVGVNIQYAIGEYYQKIQQKAVCEMQKITLQDIIDGYDKRVKECSLENYSFKIG